MKRKKRFFSFNQHFYLEIELNQFRSAYRTYKQLIKLTEAEPYLNNDETAIKAIDSFIASDELITVNENVLTNESLRYSLVRNDSFANVKGNVNKIDIRCANKRHEYSFKQDSTWKIPENWQQCDVFVFADDNTTFDIVEFPKNS